VISLSNFTGCWNKPPVVALPDSRELLDLPDKPGYVGISKGYVRELMRQLQACGQAEGTP
jgi:hypothetical protein